MEDVKKFQSRIDADAWLKFEQENPEQASLLKANPGANGLKRVIRKKADGSTHECYIPVDDIELQLAKMQEELRRLDDMPTVEDYVANMRKQGLTSPDEELVKMYINTYYGEDFMGGV